MFCDLAGSTALSELLDPEDFREVIGEYVETTVEVVHRFSGFVGQYLGDGILAYFGYPKATEDSPLLAVRAGLEIISAIEALNSRTRSGRRPPLHVRIGIHTGLLVIGEHGSSERRESAVVIGRTPNLAARLQGIAEPGNVVISADTWRLVKAHFKVESMGEHRLKGIAEPVTAYRVCDELEPTSGTRANGEHALVGRDVELSALMKDWAVVCTGQDAKIQVRGEAGIGKSRLIQEFRRTTKAAPRLWLAVRGLPQTQGSAFQPLIEFFRRWIGISRNDDAGKQLERIQNFAREYEFDAETTAMLCGLLTSSAPADSDLSPAALRERLLTWVPELLRELALKQPVAFVVEDLHWLDPSTLDTLQRLEISGPIPGALLLYTSRPEFATPWLESQAITLDRLPAARIREIIERLAGGKELPPYIVQQVIRKSDGVPLFVEEMTRMVLESDMLIEREEHYESSSPQPSIAIPDTLHALLMARLERSAGVREVAQIAAVLGQEFHYEMLRAVCPLEEDMLNAELARLTEAGILECVSGDHDLRYVFRHALIQAEAYQSLLKRKRQHYHRLIAGLLTGRFSGTLEAQPEVVAHHYTEAGWNEEAVDYWLRAAQRSIQRSASHEAIAQARRGLALIPLLPDNATRREHELGLTVALGGAETLVRGYAAPQVAEAYSRARDLSRELGSFPRIMPVLAALFGYYLASADFPAALQIAQQMEQLGIESGSDYLCEHAYFSLGAHAYYAGSLEKCVEYMHRGLATLEARDEKGILLTLETSVGLGAWCGMALLLLGRADEGERMLCAALAKAEGLNHPHSIAFARHLTQTFRFWREEPLRLLEQMDLYKSECREEGFNYWIAISTPIEGWAKLSLHNDARLLEMIQRGIHGIARTGTRLAFPQHYAPLVEALANHGRLEEAQTALHEAQQMVRETGETAYAPILPHLEAMLALKTSPPDFARAEASYREALAMADSSKARWHALRPAIGLAELLNNQGRSMEAREMLSGALSHIHQGLETPLVKRAIAVLAAL
jgi:class 3 adenylate cyclase